MASVNHVILIGHLGKDPELRYLTNGDAVANVSLATSETWKGKDGEKKEKTEWHNIVLYKRAAEVVGEHAKKGALMYFDGRIQTRKWQDKEGKDRYTTEIVVNSFQFLGGKKDAESEQEKSAQHGAGDFDEDIPF